MKVVLGIVGLLAVLGVAYGLAFAGIIPTQKWAAKSPALGKALTALHLAKPKPKAAVVAAAPPSAPAPEQATLDAEKQQIAAERAQLDKDKAALEAQQQQAPAVPAPDAAPPPDSGAKLIALYAAMSPDDLARIFAKLPDPMVVKTLMQMDEKKAGKVFAALPPDRAARLSELMESRTPTHPASAAAPAPATVLQ
ncbi:MAG: hypothetical protein JO250_08025 [Armatimonadetes bacterium]|nr:hypothetical protein [Armatimonadota bacterium]